MSTKIAISFGLVSVMVVGVIALMFALGWFSANPAAADIGAVTVTVTPNKARSIGQYTITVSGAVAMSAIPVGGSITVTFNTKTGVPSSIASSAIKLKATMVGGGGTPNQLVNAAAVIVSGKAITITVPDMDPFPGTGDNGIAANGSVIIIITQAAGIQNPNQAKTTYTLTVKTTGDPTAVTSTPYAITSFVVFSPASAARGATVTVVGGGFEKNCTICTIRFSPQNTVAPINGAVGSGSIDANGVFVGSVTLTAATSAGGYVWVTDSAGISQVSGTTFLQKASAAPRSPTGMAGSPVRVDLIDFTGNAGIATVTVSGTPATFTALNLPPTGNTTALNPFKFVVPKKQVGTHLVIIVDSTGKSASFNLEVVLRILTVLPNPAAIGQEITVEGTGFTENGTILAGDLTGSGNAVLNSADIAIDIDGAWTLTTRLDTLESSAGRISDSYTVTARDKGADGISGNGDDLIGRSSGFNRTARTLTVTPSTAAPGILVELNVTGMTVNDGENATTATFTVTASSGTLAGFIVFPVGSDGSGTGTITIPLDAAVGTITLKATDNAAALNANATNSRTAVANLRVPPGTIAVVPPQASTGKFVTVTGLNFPPNTAAVTMTIGGANAMPIGGFVTDSNGEFSVVTQVPGAVVGGSLTPGAKIVVVTVGFISGTTTGFSVPNPSITITPPAAEVEDTIVISGTGFNALTTVTVLSIGSQSALPSPAPIATFDGDIEATTIVPLLNPGTYTVVMSNAVNFTANAAFTVIATRGILCGDVHPAGGGDGDDDVFDALRKLKIAVGLVIPDERERIAGDVHPDNETGPDGDGDIDVLDALRNLKASVGLVTITSCGGPR